MASPAAQRSVAAPACPRCGGPSEHAFDATDRNRAVTAERFTYRRCSVCGATWLVDVPENLADYYPGDYHDFLEGEALASAAAEEAPRIAMLRRHVSAGRLVEIGPSQGVFAAAARGAGFSVTGLEMDEACCRHLGSVVGVEAIQTDDPAAALDGLPPSRAVVMFHLIEHLPNPWEVLRAAAANLEDGGVVMVATPNPNSFQARLLRSRWVHLDAPRHVTLIPLPALHSEAAELGLHMVDATTNDPVGRTLTRMGWQRSLVTAPTLRDSPRFGYTLGQTLTPLFNAFESRGLRGAAYTAVWRKGSRTEAS